MISKKARVIAIDGPSASGKSSLAAAVADKLNIPYVSTGMMFRAVAHAAMVANIDVDAPDLTILRSVLNTLKFEYRHDGDGWRLWVNDRIGGEALRQPAVAAAASALAKLDVVRDFLAAAERRMAERGWLVMEGRDIGTVIFPDAAFKFFVTATPEERARRRLAQAGESMDGATLASVAQAIAERDRQDCSRAIAPLRQAEDAVLLDTTAMSLAAEVDFIVERVKNGLF